MSFRRDRMNSTAMRLVLFVLLVATLLGTTGWLSPASAQGAKGAGSRGAAERAAVELKRGMTLDEVQKLLGKPWRTALSGTAGADTGTLRWTYTGLATSAASEQNLNIDFSAKAAGDWSVSGWGWSTY